MVLLTVMLAVAAPVLAQHRDRGGDRDRFRSGGDARQAMSHEERQRLRQDVDAARGNYGRGGPPAQQRQGMAPEEREKLRRDVQDANREMRRR